MVQALARQEGVDMETEALNKLALQWEREHAAAPPAAPASSSATCKACETMKKDRNGGAPGFLAGRAVLGGKGRVSPPVSRPDR